MGMRKKNNQREAQRRLISQKKRAEKKIKRAKKERTPGQKLHNTMHGRA